MLKTTKKKYRIRFGFKTLSALTVLFAGIAWWYAIGYAMWLDYRDRAAFRSIPQYELGQSATTRRANVVVPGLVTIIGDSRLKHWNLVDDGHALADGRFVTEGRDGTIRFWDLESGESVRTLFAERVLASGDGNRYFTRQGDHIECFRTDGDQLIFETKLPEIPKGNGFGWATNHTGSLIALVRNNEIHFFDVDEEKWSIEKPAGIKNLFCLHCHPIMNSSGGLVLIPCHSKIYLHDRNKFANPEHKTESIAMQSSVADRSPITVMKLSGEQQGVFLADMSGNLGKLNLATREIVEYDTGNFFPIHGLSVTNDGIAYDQAADIVHLNLKGDEAGPKQPMLDCYLNMRFIKDDFSRRLVGGQENRLHIWNRTREITPGVDRTWTPTCIEFSTDGWSLAVGCADGRVRIFRVGSWAQVREIDFGTHPIKSLAYSSSGQLAVRDLSRIAIFQNEKGNEIFESKAKGVFFHHAMAFSKDGSTFAFGLSTGAKGSVEVVDLNGKVKTKSLVIPPTEKRQPGFMGLQRRQTTKNLNFKGSLFFAGTEDFIFAASAFQNVTVWDSNNGSLLGHIGKPEIASGWPYPKAVKSPDGRFIAMQSCSNAIGVWRGIENGILTTNNEPIHYVKEQGNEFDFCFSHSGKELASVSNDGFLRIRDTSTFEVLHAIQLSGKGSRIPSVKYSRNDRYIATLNGNGTVYIIRNPTTLPK